MSQTKTSEQAITWLRSMASDQDIFNSINADGALATIEHYKKRAERLGCVISNLRRQRDRAWAALNETRKELEEVRKQNENSKDIHFCACCGRPVQTEIVKTTEDWYVRGRQVKLDNVRSRICLRCGNTIFDRALYEEALARLADQEGTDDEGSD